MMLGIMLLFEKQNQSPPLIREGEGHRSAADRLALQHTTGEARPNETKWIIALCSVIEHPWVN